MKIWNYRCYVDDRGNNPVLTWLSALSKKAQANFKRNLEIIECLEIADWHKPSPTSYVNNHIYVIRFKDENRTQWRIYGHHNIEKKVFVLSFYGFEKGNRYEPSVEQCVNVGSNRMEQCIADWDTRTCSCLSTSHKKPTTSSDCEQVRLVR